MYFYIQFKERKKIVLGIIQNMIDMIIVLPLRHKS